MKSTLLAVLSLSVAMTLSPAFAQEQLNAVSPALEKYAQGPIAELWRRPDLAPRDRSIVTVAALIAGNQGVALSGQIGLALDNGVKPREISEILTHLAFYSGWGNISGAAAAVHSAFVQRGIGNDQLPPATPPSPLRLDVAGETQRAQNVEAQFGSVSPGVVQYTTDVLFRDLWLRPDLAPRDRSLVTVSALVAAGQVAQIPYHLNRAMDNGLTAEEAGEMLTQLAFYAGWPRVFSALPVVKDVIGKRPGSRGRKAVNERGQHESFAITILAAATLACAAAQAQTIEIVPNGSRAAIKGATQTFTGSVTVDPLFPTNEQRPYSGGHVTFEPGARTAWHTHPAGQALIVTAGAGWVQQWDGERRNIKPGDVVWIPPNVKHWHGATTTTAMSHIALQQAVGGKTVDWLEQVVDQPYGK